MKKIPNQDVSFDELTKIILAPKNTISLLKPECFASFDTIRGSCTEDDLPPSLNCIDVKT